MSEHDDGGQAFPRASTISDGTPGMCLRDYFAGQALAGMLANPTTANVSQIGITAYAFADAMLKARKP